MSEQADLRARFEAIKAHYRPHMRAMASRSDEWAIGAYAWAAGRTGISLTPIERALWSDIRAENAVFYPQLPVGPFFVDFGNPAAKVAIECDGAAWHLDKAKDAARDKELNEMGWKVYRITGSRCFSDDIEGVDGDGNATITLSSAREFVKDVCDYHPVRRGCLSTKSLGPTSIQDALVERIKWLAKCNGVTIA